MKILALCDSPTLTSGFARVAQNLFKHWAKRGVQIDCWAICFTGWGYKNVPYVNLLYPAGDSAQWSTPQHLDCFLRRLESGGYTHVWIMQDTFLLAASGFPAALRKVCTEKKIRSMLYFPVDAELDPLWADIIAAVDVPVAYTAFGARDAESKAKQRAAFLGERKEPGMNYEFKCEHLPHGVDTAVFQPLKERKELRHRFYERNPWLKDDDFVIINVNSNQSRKDPPRSLEILAGLRKVGVPAKLVMHMPGIGSPDQQINLEIVGRQLGLKQNEEWGHHGMLFRGSQGMLRDDGPEGLAGMYNMADLYLTTTLGEGWGLSITEALACGTPVAMPNHTSCLEIGCQLTDHGLTSMYVPLEIEDGAVVHRADNSRMRRRVDLEQAVSSIKMYYESGQWRSRVPIGTKPELKKWLDWDRIAGEMLRLWKKVPEGVKAPAPVVPALPGSDTLYAEFGGLEVCNP